MLEEAKRIVLVDDEPGVLESIQTGIDWEKLGTRICGAFTDGQKALDYIGENPVDILITDITMPTFNGLELCTRVQALRPEVKFIIISGYADFAYAQKSIRFGALGYCLKPVDYDELRGYIRKAVQPSSNGQDCDPELVEALYENDIPRLRRILESEGLEEPIYTAVSIGRTPLKQLFDGLCQPLGYHEHLYLFRQPPREISEKMLEDSDVDGISVSTLPVEFADLQSAVFQNLYDSCQFFFHRESRVFRTHAAYLEGVQQEIAPLLYQPAALRALLLSWSDQLSHISQALDIYNYIFCQLGIDLEIYSYQQLLSTYRSYEEMVAGILEAMTPDVEKEINEGGYSRGFLKIIKYIHENYSTDISTADIAREFNMNPSYVSQLFKKETGNTIVKYLTSLRMQKAEELLQNTDLPVSAISDACGFNDYFYFIKLFKKHTSCSPSQYRRKLAGDPDGAEDSKE